MNQTTNVRTTKTPFNSNRKNQQLRNFSFYRLRGIQANLSNLINTQSYFNHDEWRKLNGAYDLITDVITKRKENYKRFREENEQLRVTFNIK